MDIQTANRSDAAVISTLLTRLSIEYIVGGFGAEGRANMLNSMTPEAIEDFFDQGFRYHLGVENEQVVGVAGTRDNSHLFHLFVEGNHQGRGYASVLWAVAKQACLDSGKNPGYFTVNSSLNSQDVYKHWGFKPIGGIREGGGVKDLPMKMEVGS
ncbi:MAG: GNAT family N-acetyltransferase [Pseudomonadales bacterium]